jgi:hypothetical protein
VATSSSACAWYQRSCLDGAFLVVAAQAGGDEKDDDGDDEEDVGARGQRLGREPQRAAARSRENSCLTL